MPVCVCGWVLCLDGVSVCVCCVVVVYVLCSSGVCMCFVAVVFMFAEHMYATVYIQQKTYCITLYTPLHTTTHHHITPPHLEYRYVEG